MARWISRCDFAGDELLIGRGMRRDRVGGHHRRQALRATSGAPLARDGAVCDGEEPRPEAALLRIARKAVPRMKEQVLHGVFGVLAMLELTQQQREQARSVWANEIGECPLVPVPSALDEVWCRLGSEAVEHHTSRTPHGRNYCVPGDFRVARRIGCSDSSLSRRRSGAACRVERSRPPGSSRARRGGCR